MAVVVPILMAASGATAAVATALGVSATMVTVGTSVLMAATGIGEKINKAASKVFGEDLVGFANIAGSAFMAFGGAGATGAEGAADAASGGLDLSGALDGAANADLSGALAPSFGDALAGGATFDPSAALVPEFAATLDPWASAPDQLPNEMARLGRGPLSQQGGPLDTGSSAAGAAARGASTSPTAVTNTDASLFEKFQRLPERTQAALIQVGGSTLSGAAQGYSQGRLAEEERREQRRRDAIYRSGSGLRVGGNYSYGPARPTTGGNGG